MKIKTKHMFKVLKVINKIGILDKIKELFRKVEGKNKKEIEKLQEEVGMNIVISIIEGMEDAENEIYDLVADVEGKKIEEVAEQDVTDTIETLKNIFTSDVFKGFFTSISK